MSNWNRIAHTKSGNADGPGGPYLAPHTGTVNTIGANLYVLAISHYNNGLNPDPALDIIDAAGGANTYQLVPGQGAGTDPNTRITYLVCFNPITSPTEQWQLSNTSGHVSYAGLSASAWSGCSGSQTPGVVGDGSTTSTPAAGTIGSAGDLVITAVADYVVTVSSIDSGFDLFDQSDYTNSNNIGLAVAWQDIPGGIAGPVNPIWTLAGSPSSCAVQSISITGSGVVASKVPYQPMYQWAPILAQ